MWQNNSNGRTSPGQSNLHLQLVNLRLEQFPPLDQTGLRSDHVGHTGKASGWEIAGNLLISFSMDDDSLTIALDLLIERTLDSF